MHYDGLNFECNEIFPYVCVYKNLVPDADLLLDVIKGYSGEGPTIFSPWLKWYEFGKKIDCSTSEKVPEGTPYSHVRFVERTKEIRRTAFSHYMAKFDVPEMRSMFIQNSVNIAVYDTDKTFDDNSEMVMNYHTDFEVSKIKKNEVNFLLTCNIYYNDDYDGGELRFTNTSETVSYKPKAGETIVFPSGSPYFPKNIPYFHAVGKVSGKPKFFSRNYVMYDHTPDCLIEKEIQQTYDFTPEPNQLVIRGKDFITSELVKQYYSWTAL